MNQNGIEQAKKQAEELKDIEFDICFCSPQMRAVQTGEIIYKGKMILDERLAEIDCGEFEGTEENGESAPITEKIVMPTIEGAVITAEGASNANVKANIISATQAVTGLATHKIQVFQMRRN